MAAKTFDDFQEDATINPSPSPGDPPYWMKSTDYFVGFTSTAPGGERKWALSAVREDFKYAFPQLNGVTMTLLINGTTGNVTFPSNPAHLTAAGLTLVTCSKTGANYTLTFITGLFASANYAVFAYPSLTTEPILSYVTAKTATSLTINCVDRTNTAKVPAFLSVHLVEQS